jgi:hypothetical protein
MHQMAQHVMMVVMVHLHPSIHVVMVPFVHHHSIFGNCRRCDRDRGQRRQHVGNLLHCGLSWGEFTSKERKDDRSVPLAFKKICEPLFRFAYAGQFLNWCYRLIHRRDDLTGGIF